MTATEQPTPNGTHKLPTGGRVRRDDEATSASPRAQPMALVSPGTPTGPTMPSPTR